MEAQTWADSLSEILRRFASIPSLYTEAALECNILQKFRSEDFPFRIGD